MHDPEAVVAALDKLTDAEWEAVCYAMTESLSNDTIRSKGGAPPLRSLHSFRGR